MANPTNTELPQGVTFQPTQENFPKSTVLRSKLSFFSNKKVILFGSIGLVVLVLCGLLITVLAKPKQVVQTTPTTITMWGKSVEESVIADLITQFESENPLIKVKYERQSETDYKERIQTRLQLQNATALPDIIEIDEPWLNQISPYLKTVNDPTTLNRFANQEIKNNTINNSIFAVPFRFDAMTLAYNEAHLAEINLSEADFNALDWSSLVTRAKNLTKTKKVKIPNSSQEYDQIVRAGIGIGSPTNVMNSDKILELLLVQNDADIFDPVTNKFKITTKFNEVIDFYTNFAIENVWDDTIGNDIDAFTKGKVSMVLVKSSDIDTIVSLNPSLKFKTVLPAKIGGIKNISLSTSLAMPKIKNTQPQAMKFIEFLSRTDSGNNLFKAKNRNTFIPAQFESLNQIPKESPFSVFSDISPTAEQFTTPDYEATSLELRKFLTNSFSNTFDNLQAGQKASKFKVDTQGLETRLNNILKSKITPTPTLTN